MKKITYRGRQIEIRERGGLFVAHIAGDKGCGIGATPKEAREKLITMFPTKFERRQDEAIDQ